MVHDEAADVPMDALFNADEIDDPFSSAADKQIEAIDICERLQVRLKGRMRPDEAEVNAEAEWILDRLSIHSVLKLDADGRLLTPDFKYKLLTRKKDGKVKILKVLNMLRTKLNDVPMIAHHRKHEYSDELDEESIWIIYNLD